jgi:hypothetical protein
MKSLFTLPTCLAATLLLVGAPKTQAHTWTEQLTVVASNGTFVGTPGYARGYVPGSDAANVNLIPPNGRSTGNAILPSDLMCKDSQQIGSQAPNFPTLKAAAGDQVAIRYLENGHVTKPDTPPGKPAGSGTVYIYGTSKPANTDTYLGIQHVWNTEGTGGDSRGVLLATRPFDDGQCYEFNDQPISEERQAKFPHADVSPMFKDIWCQSDVQLPANATNTYTLYWVWEWPTLDASGKVITNESYTSCMDIDVSGSTEGSSNKGASFIQGQNINFAAIQGQLANEFLVKPTFGTTPAPAPAPAPAPSSAESSSPTLTSAPRSFQTVTVTASPAMETVYITVTDDQASAELTTTIQSTYSTTSTITVSPLSAFSSQPAAGTTPAPPTPALSSQTPSVQPTVSPFLSADSSPIAQTQTSQPTPAPTTRPVTSIPIALTSAANSTIARRARVRRFRI